MFTGLIEEVGDVVIVRAHERGTELQIAAPVIAKQVSRGESIAVNGCCLTLTSRSRDRLSFDLLEETTARTNLQALRQDSPVNLERALRADGRLGGHFVQGHVDCVTPIIAFDVKGVDFRLEVELPQDFAQYVTCKGSIAINGISLTIAEVLPRSFAVWIIPYTKLHTNLDRGAIGDLVNLEFDIRERRRENDRPGRSTEMMVRRSPRHRPQIVGVIAPMPILEHALRMRTPPDLFELRLDRLAGMADRGESLLPKLRAPPVITARHPREGGAGQLRLQQRRDLLARFFNHAEYIDVELRSARALRPLLRLAQNKNVRRIISFHLFQRDTECANFGDQSTRGEIAWRKYFQSRHAHRHTGGNRTFARVHDKQSFGSCTSRHGNRNTRGDFTCPVGPRRLSAYLRIGRFFQRHQRTTVFENNSAR